MAPQAMEDRSGRAVVALLFLMTGFAALLTQVTWQRVIALHSGVDLSSTVIVVAAFLGGLGVGNLIGGVLADRLGPVASLRVLSISYLAIAAYCLISTWLLFDVYRSIGVELDLAVLRFGFNAVLLLIPTVLQGLSLPLIARVVVRDPAESGPVVGRFSATNTIGAALGAAVGGWVLLGTYGFATAAQIAAGIYLAVAVLFGWLSLGVRWRPGRARSLAGSLVAAALALAAGAAAHIVAGDVALIAKYQQVLTVLTALVVYVVGVIATQWDHWGETGGRTDAAGPTPVPAVPSTDPSPGSEVGTAARPAWVWFAVYGVTGGVALGLELVFFRVIDAVMRSNSYTFGHVLSMYLALLAAGAAAGASVASRVTDKRRAFLWIQFGVGVTALAAAIVAFDVLPETLLSGEAETWFNTDGFSGGFGEADTRSKLIFGVVLPLVLMGAPVLLMGASFPFVQGLVTDDLRSLGTRTGRLTAANLVGNVVGAVVTGFVLIEHLGSAGTYRVLFLPLAAAGGIAAASAASGRARWIQGGAVLSVAGTLLVALPTNDELWARLHGTTPDSMLIAEDRSCASGLELYGEDGAGGRQLTINGAAQNGHPFDDFHVLIGLLPALVHPEADRGLAIGLGIGSTSDAMLFSDRVDQVTSVELCGGNYDLVDELADQGVPEFVRLRDDERHERIVGDGRRHLLVTDRGYDIVVPDTVRPNAAGSGNLYSREFQELVDDRLSDDGVTAGWIPTLRVLNAVSTTFPHVVEVTVPSYNDSSLYLASRTPMELDRRVLLERFDALPEGVLAPEQARSIRAFLETFEPTCVNDGSAAPRPRAVLENRDLQPRDEYFLTNGGIGESEVVRTCG